MHPEVSVIITSYNYGRFLAGALESTLGQTFGDFEVIVVDDGSTDDTSEVVRRYLDDPRVRYLHTEHIGQPGAKNAGIREARSPFVAFLDADDLWLPTKLERQLELFRSDPDLGVTYTRQILIDEEGYELEYKQPILHQGQVLETLFRGNFVCFSSSMIARRVLDEVGSFDEGIPMSIDYDLWLRVAMRHRFDYVDEPLVKYRTGHANLSRRLVERYLIDLGIRQRFLDERGGRNLLDPAVVRVTLRTNYSNIAPERAIPISGPRPAPVSAIAGRCAGGRQGVEGSGEPGTAGSRAAWAAPRHGPVR